MKAMLSIKALENALMTVLVLCLVALVCTVVDRAVIHPITVSPPQVVQLKDPIKQDSTRQGNTTPAPQQPGYAVAVVSATSVPTGEFPVAFGFLAIAIAFWALMAHRTRDPKPAADSRR